MLGALASVMGPLQLAGASGSNFYVSPTGTNPRCVASFPCSFQYALANAGPSATIHLAGGVYDEQPTISTSGLTIEGRNNGGVVFEKTNAAQNSFKPDGVTPVTALAYVSPGTTGVTLKNLDIDASNANLPAGENYSGVYADSASVTLDHVRVQNVVPGTGFTGVQTGVSIYARSDAAYPSTPANIAMKYVTVTNYNKGGVVCVDANTTCSIKNGTVTGHGATTVTAQNGIEIGFGAGGSVTSTTVTGNNYTPEPQAAGVLIYDAAAGVVVTKSKLSNNDQNLVVYNDGSPSYPDSDNPTITHNTAGPSAAGAWDGIYLESITGATVSNNTANNNAEFGISAYGTSNSTFSGNKASGNAQGGIYISGDGVANSTSENNTVTMSTVKTNGGIGIHADLGTANSTFSNNRATGNTGYDMADETSPPPSGTAGTANFWSGSHCTTHASSLPTGLC
jgi:parallel beta-helix repeat protein